MRVAIFEVIVQRDFVGSFGAVADLYVVAVQTRGCERLGHDRGIALIAFGSH